LWTRDLLRAKKRQGWERLCGEGAKVFFAPALGAPGGRDHSAGHAKTDAPKQHLSGQPGGRLRVAASANQVLYLSFPRFFACCNAVRTGLQEDAPPAEVQAVAPPRRAPARRRMAGRIRLKINTPRPAAKPRGGVSINPFQRPVIRCGHPPAGGAPNAGARAPENKNSFARLHKKL